MAVLAKTNILKFTAALLIYGGAFLVLIYVLGISPPDDETALWFILPGIATFAFLFQIVDSAAGMGLGTAMAPLLIALGYSPLEIVPTLLVAQMFTGLLSGWVHRDVGNIDIDFLPPNRLGRASFWIIGVGVMGTITSVILVYDTLSLPDRMIETYVAVLVICAGIFVLFRKKYQAGRTYHKRWLIGFSVLAAINKGIGAGGYGPVLIMGALIAGVREKAAVALTVFSEGVVSIAGVITFFILFRGGLEVSFVLLPSILFGTFVSAFAAPHLTRLCPPRFFKYFLPLYSIAIGFFVLGKLYFFSYN